MSKKIDKKCAYLADNRHECLMVKGGLYIPMPEHIDLFCQTSNFSQCHQYIKGLEFVRESAKKYGYILDESRRRFRRVRERLSLSLLLCNEAGELLDILDSNAHTIDLSLGGFRFESNARLQPHETVAFSFGHEFSSPAWTGVGEVRWTEDTGDGIKFLSGLTFTDHKTAQAVGHHIGIPGIPMV